MRHQSSNFQQLFRQERVLRDLERMLVKDIRDFYDVRMTDEERQRQRLKIQIERLIKEQTEPI